jgi:predicted nucleotidyltransferase
VDLHPDFRDLLAEFVRSTVRFVLVGGYAVGHHAKPRATKDLDLLVSGSTENLARVAEALDRFGAPRSVVDAARTMGESDVVYMGVEPVRVDMMRMADGIDTDSVIVRADRLRIGALEVPVIALEDLITNKRAAGRARDLADVELLERVLQRRR